MRSTKVYKEEMRDLEHSREHSPLQGGKFGSEGKEGRKGGRMELLTLLEQGAWTRAAMNAVLSVIVCVAAAWLGATLARTF